MMVKKYWIIIAIGMVLVAGGVLSWLLLPNNEEAPAPSQPEQNASQTQTSPEPEPQYSIDEPDSLWVVVNKQRPLPLDFVPQNLVAPDIKLRWASTAESMQVSEVIKDDLEALYQASVAAGFDLMLISAYRSAEYQEQLFKNYSNTYGEEEANQFSARPGQSEHQTGLVVDLGRTDQECELLTCFGELPEGQWLAQNAHKYGFIVRYLEGKADITGYMYEPWHLRYVGKDLAEKLYRSGQTMEEYFDLI